ncbi:unnamed protein product, partial [Allacma fusca]
LNGKYSPSHRIPIG